MKNAIRLKTISQWSLLNQINCYLGKWKIPKDVIKKIYYMLQSKELGKNGFVVLCLKDVKDDIIGLDEIIDLYPYRCTWDDRIDEIRLSPGKTKKCWYISYAGIKEQKTKIAVIFNQKTN